MVLTKFSPKNKRKINLTGSNVTKQKKSKWFAIADAVFLKKKKFIRFSVKYVASFSNMFPLRSSINSLFGHIGMFARNHAKPNIELADRRGNHHECAFVVILEKSR